MTARRSTLDFEEKRRIVNRVRLDTLNAIDELVIRTMSEGNDVEAVSRRVKKALETEMDEAASLLMKLTATQSRPIVENWTYYPDITLTTGHLHHSRKQGITDRGRRVAQKIREIQENLDIFRSLAGLSN